MTFPKATTTLVCCVALAVTHPLARVPQQPNSVPVDQRQLLKQLQSTDWTTRVGALEQIGKIPPALRSVGLVRGVVKEIVHEQALLRVGRKTATAEPDPEAEVDYYGDLLDIAAESHDPQVLPCLVAGVNTGRNIIDAVAGFGDQAVPLLVAGIQANPEAEYVFAAMFSLNEIVKGPTPISAAHRKQLVALVDSNLRGRRLSVVVAHAIQLGVSLGEPAILPQLRALADAKTPTDAGLNLIDPKSFWEAQGLASFALARIH